MSDEAAGDGGVARQPSQRTQRDARFAVLWPPPSLPRIAEYAWMLEKLGRLLGRGTWNAFGGNIVNSAPSWVFMPGKRGRQVSIVGSGSTAGHRDRRLLKSRRAPAELMARESNGSWTWLDLGRHDSSGAAEERVVGKADGDRPAVANMAARAHDLQAHCAGRVAPKGQAGTPRSRPSQVNTTFA